MRKRLLLILALAILAISASVGCSGESPCSSTLTILSITDGEVFVMKTGTDDWVEAEVEMSLEVGDTVKTGDDSGAEVTFFDGSTIGLEAGTQIEILTLDLACDTGVTTITLMQTIGTTISRVTKLIDPASGYYVETPTGVAAVRGSTLIVTILEDGATQTTQICNVEGDIFGVAQGFELDIPEGRCAIIRPGQPPELVPLNNPPLAISDSFVTDADNSVTVDAPGVLSNDSDQDGDTLAVTALNTSGTIGTVTAWDADGSFTYDPNGQFEYLRTGNSTSDSFTYTVSDGNGGTDTATVTVIINGVYDPPVYYPPVYYPPVNYPPVAVDDSATTDEDNPVTVAAPGVLDNDSDPDAGDTLTVTAVQTSGTVGGVTSWSANGSFTYNPDGQFEYLQAGDSATASFAYTISDGRGGTDTATVTITIDGVNDAPGNNYPVAVDDSATTQQDTPVTINVLSNDSDPDAGDILTVASVTQGTHGSVTINASNVIYTPDPGYIGTDSFMYTISDGHGGTDTATVSVTVTETPATSATLTITIDTNAHAPIYIQDTTTGALVINGNVQTSATIEVAGGHSYCVWLEAANVTYDVKNSHGWSVGPAPNGGEQACGYAAAGSNTPLHFTETQT